MNQRVKQDIAKLDKQIGELMEKLTISEVKGTQLESLIQQYSLSSSSPQRSKTSKGKRSPKKSPKKSPKRSNVNDISTISGTSRNSSFRSNHTLK